MDSIRMMHMIASSLIILASIGLFLWLWFDTYYTINRNTLKVKWGPFFWNINVSEIIFIRLNQKTIGGFWKGSMRVGLVKSLRVKGSCSSKR